MAKNNLQSLAFPTLNESQITELARYADATPKKFRAGEALFRCGDRDFEFFTDWEVFEIATEELRKILNQVPQLRNLILRLYRAPSTAAGVRCLYGLAWQQYADRGRRKYRRDVGSIRP